MKQKVEKLTKLLNMMKSVKQDTTIELLLQVTMAEIILELSKKVE